MYVLSGWDFSIWVIERRHLPAKYRRYLLRGSAFARLFVTRVGRLFAQSDVGEQGQLISVVTIGRGKWAEGLRGVFSERRRHHQFGAKTGACAVLHPIVLDFIVAGIDSEAKETVRIELFMQFFTQRIPYGRICGFMRHDIACFVVLMYQRLDGLHRLISA